MRLIVCFDFATDDPKVAYRALNRIIVGTDPISMGWETSDEWYPSLESDEAGDPNVLQTAICSVIEEKEDIDIFMKEAEDDA